ncbi:MAG: hypothetical protein AB1847_23185 [bacterium]
MHTDEFEISLSRELNVCKNTIKKVERTLVDMEKKYNLKTEVFVEKFHNGEITEFNEDFIAWINNYETLKRWSDMMKQYEEMFRIMKI